MIKNIIFDMGEVLAFYRPRLACDAYTKSKEDAALILQELFQKEEWGMTDQGVLSDDEILARVWPRLPQRLRDTCAEVYLHWHEHALLPNEDMPALIHELHARGLHAYLCSNTSSRFHVFRADIPAIALLDGVLASADERCVKPNEEIYRRLFRKFNLVPEECFFIDDVPANIEGGRACGMDGFVFTGSLADLRAALAEKGVL